MKNFYYTKEHEWISLEDHDTSLAYMGITDYAIELLGTITFIELPKVGAVVTRHDACAVVESAKVASDVYAPLSGTVVSINNALIDNPALINEDPMNGGWLIQLAISETSELDSLMSQSNYESYKA